MSKCLWHAWQAFDVWYVPFVAIASKSAAKANTSFEQRSLVSSEHIFDKVECLKLKFCDSAVNVGHGSCCARAMDVHRIVRGDKGKQVELLPS